ncbi:MAG: cytochrome c [Candidatus Binatia bacterium]
MTLSFASSSGRSRRRRRAFGRAALALLLATSAAACRQDMHDAPKYEPLEASPFFKDKRASRSLPAGTIARGGLREDALLHTGRDESGLAETFPFPVTAGVLERGRERYNIYCSPCHARTGDGDGMIVQRGYKRPPSFHEERLRGMSAGYFVQVITNGFVSMPSYALQVKAEDRWAITAYIKALQLSRHTSAADLTSAERTRLEKGETEPPAESGGAHGGHGKEAHGG